MASLSALLLLPARPIAPGPPRTAAFIATGLLAALALPAVWRARALYCAMRRRPGLQLCLVLIAAALIVRPELSGELWWPSCAILVMLAIVASLRRTLAYCLLVLGANMAGHVVAGDLHEIAAVAVIGLWIGYPLWTVTIATISDRLATQVLCLNATRPAQRLRPPPRRVRAWTDEPLRRPPPSAVAAEGEAEPMLERQSATSRTRGLSARHIQVVALLADGLRHRDIAACLSISERQLQRLIVEAVARLDVGNIYRLVAVAVSEGIVPAPPVAPDAGDDGAR